MTITREQVAALQPGDVVELAHGSHDGVTLRGPVRTHPDSRVVWVGDTLLMDLRGDLQNVHQWATLTVVSRAPRPLYVNHPRTEPVPGDVVRDADGNDPLALFIYAPDPGEDSADPWPWLCSDADWEARHGLPARLRLLVDGETGQVVQ